MIDGDTGRYFLDCPKYGLHDITPCTIYPYWQGDMAAIRLRRLHRRLAFRRRWFGWAAWCAWRLSR